MSVLASFTLQHAIVAQLKADSALLALLGADRIFDAVPAKAAYPYLAYGPVTMRDWSTGSSSGQEHFISLNIYSRQPGFREAYALSDAVIEGLENAMLEVDDHKLVLFRFDAAEFRRQNDALTTRALVSFRALTEKL
jgi:hypothetical protein